MCSRFVFAENLEGEVNGLRHVLAFCRWQRDSDWATCRWQSVAEWDRHSAMERDMPVMSFEWKLVAEPVMQLYTESTDGSYIEYKESALVWHHRFADPDFGSWQAKELQNHLESVLANEPVTVKSGAQIVEVTPQVGCPHVLGHHHHQHMMGIEVVNSQQPKFADFFFVDESLCGYGPCLLSTLTLYGTLRLIYAGIWLLGALVF